MPAIVQYEFNNENQWKNAGEPKLIETAEAIIPLGFNPETEKYHVEVLYTDTDDIPDNGLLAAKTVKPIPHKFLGYETLEEYEYRKSLEPESEPI